MKVSYDSTAATISVNENQKLGFLIWKPFKTSDEYKQVLSKALEIIDQEKLENWIPDTREARVVSPDDRKWTEDYFFPQAIALGIRKIAFVSPLDDAFKKYYATKLKESQAGKQVAFEIFSDLRDAEKWILKG